MTTQDFTYDEAHPLDPQTFTVPAGVRTLTVRAAGGGTWWTNATDKANGPQRGIWADVPVNPGDELAIVLGGGSSDTDPGTNGGGAGGGGIAYDNPDDGPYLDWRGWGGGGRTEIRRNGQPWIVAGGAAGAVEASVAAEDAMVVTATGWPVPGAAADPRVVLPLSPVGPGFTLVDTLPGAAGGEAIGAAGVLAGSSAGSGGGGGGWGGGASGGIVVYQRNTDPWPQPSRAPTPGRMGGFLLPGTTTSAYWNPSLDGDYLANAHGHGWVRLEWTSGSGRWSVSRVPF